MRLATMVQGIVFCGTPHRGSSFADAASLLGRFFGGSQEHVNEMRANADSLDILHDGFVEWQSTNLTPIASYAENVGIYRKRALLRPIPLGLVVPRASANPNIQGHTIRDIDEDHLTLVKPRSRQHDVYLGTLRFISTALNRPALSPPELARAEPSRPVLAPAEQSCEVEGEQEHGKGASAQRNLISLDDLERQLVARALEIRCRPAMRQQEKTEIRVRRLGRIRRFAFVVLALSLTSAAVMILVSQAGLWWTVALCGIVAGCAVYVGLFDAPRRLELATSVSPRELRKPRNSVDSYEAEWLDLLVEFVRLYSRGSRLRSGAIVAAAWDLNDEAERMYAELRAAKNGAEQERQASERQLSMAEDAVEMRMLQGHVETSISLCGVASRRAEAASELCYKIGRAVTVMTAIKDAPLASFDSLDDIARMIHDAQFSSLPLSELRAAVRIPSASRRRWARNRHRSRWPRGDLRRRWPILSPRRQGLSGTFWSRGDSGRRVASAKNSPS